MSSTYLQKARRPEFLRHYGYLKLNFPEFMPYPFHVQEVSYTYTVPFTALIIAVG